MNSRELRNPDPQPPAAGPAAPVPSYIRAALGYNCAMPLTIVILAAGQGKRMRSDLPKVLQPLAGRPLLGHVIDTAQELAPSAIHVVFGHGGDRVRQALPEAPVSWVLQAEQLGTGHAVAQAMPQVDDRELVLVLYGDVPLIRAAESVTRMRTLVDGWTLDRSGVFLNYDGQPVPW